MTDTPQPPPANDNGNLYCAETGKPIKAPPKGKITPYESLTHWAQSCIAHSTNNIGHGGLDLDTMEAAFVIRNGGGTLTIPWTKGQSITMDHMDSLAALLRDAIYFVDKHRFEGNGGGGDA